MRVTLIISSLSGGGAERVMSLMANHWARSGWDVTLVTYEQTKDLAPPYELDERVERVQLDYGPLVGAVPLASRLKLVGLYNVSRLVVSLRRFLRRHRPDVVISFLDLTNVFTLLATAGLALPVIVSERTDPHHHHIGRLNDALRRLTYPRAACVVTQSATALAYFSPAVRRHGQVVPNMVVTPPPAPRRVEASPGKLLLALGRLEHVKGYDLLLRAFAGIAGRNPDWRLEIVGEGPQRAELERLRDQLGLADRVALPGRSNAVYDELRRADLFVLSSRFEGFPNALCEAMACGLPAVSFNCPSGPREVIRDGIDGVLVPPGDVAALAAALEALMQSEQRRATLAARAPEVMERFAVAKVMATWEAIIDRVRAPRQADARPRGPAT